MLVSSDRDFVPVAEFLETRGIKVIRHAKRRPARPDPHKRILAGNAGPATPYAARHPVISRVMHKLHPYRRFDLHQLELTAVKRMKRVRHPDEPPLDVSKGGS